MILRAEPRGSVFFHYFCKVEVFRLVINVHLEGFRLWLEPFFLFPNVKYLYLPCILLIFSVGFVDSEIIPIFAVSSILNRRVSSPTLAVGLFCARPYHFAGFSKMVC